jgi:hypothetical protein
MKPESSQSYSQEPATKQETKKLVQISTSSSDFSIPD